MRKGLLNLFFLVPLLFSNSTSAQYNPNEFENYDCTFSKEIVIPFNYTKNPGSKPPPLNQIVFYSHRDQFSYWYKIIAKESGTVSLKVDPIDNKDNYTVFVYQYNKNDFCDKVYHQKANPVSPSFFINKEARENPYDLGEKSFSVKEGNIYYISILNVSINNCGHLFRLYKGNDTVKIRAIHVPCARDVSVASKKIELNVVSSSDTIIKNEIKPVKQYITVKCQVMSDRRGKLTDPKLRLVDELTGNEIAVYPSSKKEEFNFNIEKGRSYKVECAAFGYKFFDRSIKISEQLRENNLFIIKLTPLKVGDNFVMRNIYFHPNTYALRKESEQDLSRLLSYLQANEKIKIEIQGHTNGDNRIYKNRAYANMGNEWNFSGTAKKLSKMRASSIKKYLTENGIDEKRLVIKGYGGDKMIVQHPITLEDGQKNIRVEAVIIEN